MNDYGFTDVLMVLFAVQITRTYLAPFKRETSVHKARGYATWGIYILFQYLVMISGAKHPLLILLTNILLVALIQSFSCGEDFRNALFRSGVLYASWMAVEVITQNILLFAGIDGEHFFDIGNVISKIAMYIVVQVHKRWRGQNSGVPLPFRHWVELILVPAASILVIYSTYVLTLRSGMPTAFSAVSFLMILINYVIFDVYEKMGAQTLMERQNRDYEQEIRLCTRQAADREEAYRQTRLLRHDLNARLVAVKALLDEDKATEASDEIGKMIHENSLRRHQIAHSGNLALDALVNYKYSAALAEGIVMECRIETPAELPAAGTDLCVILGNLLDNALEAVRLLPQEDRKVSLTVQLSKGILLIAVENPYMGKILVDKNGRICSSKTGDHGIGIISVERTAARYGGDVSIRHDNGMFSVSVILYTGKSYV